MTGNSEFRDGWPLVLSAMLGIMMTNIHTYTLGMFIGPLENDFGWTRADITSASAIGSAMGLLLYPIVGIAIDRVGPRKIALPGVVIYCSALAGLSQAGPSIWSWWLGYAALTCGHMLASVSVWSSGVAGRFDRRRGLALGIAFAGGGICSGIMPSMANALIREFGWQQAYVILGAIGFGLAFPAALLCFHDAKSQARRASRTGAVSSLPLSGLSPTRAFRTLTFWQMALAALCLTTGILGLTVHFPQILIERGISRTSAAAIVGFVGLASIAGRVGTGFLLDRYHVRLIGSAFFALPAVTCVLLLLGTDAAIIAPLAAISLGLALGAEVDLLSYATTRYFGLRSYGVIFGIFASLLSVGAGVGPLLGGLIHDRSGGYEIMLLLSAGLFLVSSAFVFFLRKYPQVEIVDPVPDGIAISGSST